MKRLRGAWWLLCCISAQAEWVYFYTDFGNSREYYNPALANHGKATVVRVFSQFSVPEMVPIDDPKGVFKFRLMPFVSEQSSYEFDCKAQTVQLLSRTFYRDVAGKSQIVTYQSKDKFITQSSSAFSRQFQKTRVFPENFKAVKLMGVACKG